MRESLRTRLLLWHTAAVAAVITAFAASIAFVTWRTRIADVDATLSARAAQLERAISPATGGRIDLILGPGLRYDDAPNLYHVVWSPDGTVVDRSDATLAIARPDRPGTVQRDGRREMAVVSPSGIFIVVGSDLADVRRDIWSLVTRLVALGAGILVLSAALGWWLVGRALEPLGRIARTARRMIGGDLAARIRVDEADSDVGQLGLALNSAFDRLQSAIDRQRRFTADASHELRTPLTSLSTEVQWALGRPRSPEELRASLEVAGRSAQRMQSVIERLLQLARGEARRRETRRVALEEIVEHAVTEIRTLAASARVTLHVRTEPAFIEADADQLREAITNVLANAIRYNVDDGRVDVRLEVHADTVELEIADTGIGIAPDELPFVFEPFFRGDPARSRDTGGAGLGLAVTRAIVEQHGGQITCESTPGQGTRVTMRWEHPSSSDR